MLASSATQMLGLSKDVSWADVTSVFIAMMALLIALRTYRLQKRMTTELGNFSGKITSVDEDGRLRHRLELSFRNTGLIQLTLEQIGLEIAGTDDVIPTKWPDQSPKLPIQLAPNNRVVLIYYADEAKVDPRYLHAERAIAKTASGQLFSISPDEMKKWAGLIADAAHQHRVSNPSRGD